MRITCCQILILHLIELQQDMCITVLFEMDLPTRRIQIEQASHVQIWKKKNWLQR